MEKKQAQDEYLTERGVIVRVSLILILFKLFNMNGTCFSPCICIEIGFCQYTVNKRYIFMCVIMNLESNTSSKV